MMEPTIPCVPLTVGGMFLQSGLELQLGLRLIAKLLLEFFRFVEWRDRPLLR
jgi:hypothetical protein